MLKGQKEAIDIILIEAGDQLLGDLKGVMNLILEDAEDQLKEEKKKLLPIKKPHLEGFIQGIKRCKVLADAAILGNKK